MEYGRDAGAACSGWGGVQERERLAFATRNVSRSTTDCNVGAEGGHGYQKEGWRLWMTAAVKDDRSYPCVVLRAGWCRRTRGLIATQLWQNSGCRCCYT